jgi:hypothetical protein
MKRMDFMDSILFKIEKSQDWEHKVVNIYINNRNFVDILKEYESRYSNSIAGGYEGINIAYFDNIADHFMGVHEDSFLSQKGKTYLLACTCGEPDCWPFLATISVTDLYVQWSDYEQPYRSDPDEGEYWDYSNLPRYQFELKEYKEALMNLRREKQ